MREGLMSVHFLFEVEKCATESKNIRGQCTMTYKWYSDNKEVNHTLFSYYMLNVQEKWKWLGHNLVFIQ